MRWRWCSTRFAGLLEGFLRECVNSGGVWPNQCPVNAPSFLHTPLQGLPYHRPQPKHQPSQTLTSRWVCTCDCCGFSSKGATSILGPAHPPHCRFPLIPVKTIGLSLLFWLDMFSQMKREHVSFLGQTLILPLANYSPRQQRSQLSPHSLKGTRDGLLLLHTNTFAKTFE